MPIKFTYIQLILLYHHLQHIQLVYLNNVHNESLDDRTGRIIGGDPARIQDYPFTACMVKLTYWEDFRGGAAIISRFWAITAAHCMKYITDSDIRSRIAFVRSNTNFWKKNYIQHTIVGKVVHEYYNPNAEDYDVALVKVQNGFDGMYEKPIPLPSMFHKLYTGTQVTVLGWGSTHPLNFHVSDELRYVHLYLADQYRCKMANNAKKITDRMICAGAPDKDSCVYDSGGPLIQNGFLIGIVSWGPKPCANPIRPGVYTRVSHFIAWIQQKLQYYVN